MILFLNRYIKDTNATYGVFHNGSRPLWLTLERGWLNNQPNVSCIPSGTYQCVKVNSPKYGISFEVQGVGGRDGILFHSGNFAETDTRGCILLGRKFYSYKNKHGIGESKLAIEEFRSYFNGVTQFTLIII